MTAGGFEQVVGADFESSAVLGENARLTVRALPVLLSAGASDGTSNYGYGASGAALIGQDQFQSGVGGESGDKLLPDELFAFRLLP